MTAFVDLSVPVDGSTLGPPAAGSPPVDAPRLARASDELEGNIVVLRTDRSDRTWGRFPDHYSPSPYLTEDAAAWLAARRPSAVVFDFVEDGCAVTRDFTSEDFVVHRALLGRGTPLVEQATNIGAVGAGRFTLWAPFVRFVGVEAAPCRILAVAP